MALSSKALTTVARMESELGISSASATLEPLIEEASEEIQAALGRWVYRNASYAEKVPGYGGSILRVHDHLPIVSIASITHDGNTVTASNYSVHDADAGEIRHVGVWLWTALPSTDITKDRLVGTEEHLYTVTYTGGYITPAQDDAGMGTRNLPYDIERATIDLVKAAYYQRRVDPSVRKKSVSKGSVEYGGQGTQAWPASVQRIVQRYHRPAVI